MTNFWEDLKNNITEWSIVASEKAEEFTHTSKLRIDVLQLERKLSSQYVKLGSVSYTHLTLPTTHDV